MPPIIRVTAAFALGILVAMALVGHSPLLLLPTAAIILWQTTRSTAPLVFLGIITAGAITTALNNERNSARCLHLLTDGMGISGIADVVSNRDGSAELHIRSIGNTPCADLTRARLPKPPKRRTRDVSTAVARGENESAQPNASPPVAGTRVAWRGVWWEFAGRGPGKGTLILEEAYVTGKAAPVFRARAHTAARIDELFGEFAPLTASLLIARKDGIEPEVRDAFAASGLAHLLAISGTHVALVTAVLMLLGGAARLSSRANAITAVAGSIAYVLFLGAPYAAVRAAVQVTLLMASRLLQRPAYPFALMAAAALFILAIDPSALFDAGFQLSFAGIIGILLWRKPLIHVMPESVPLVLRDSVATSTAASIATTPIAAWHFAQVSVISVFANLLAIPLVTIIVPGAAAALALSMISMPLGQFVAGGMVLLLARLEQVATMAANVPYGHFSITREGVVLLTAASLLSMLYTKSRRIGSRIATAVTAASIVLAATLVQPVTRVTRGNAIELYMIDVGQGDAIAIRTPRGRWLLVDAGPRSATFDAGARRVVPFLEKQGARTIDVMLITHPHLDHYGGGRAVLEQLRVRRILDPAGTRAEDPVFAQAAKDEPAEWLPARMGGRILVDDVEVEVLFPDSAALDAPRDANDFSLVAAVRYGKFTALLTGDAPASVELQLLRRFGSRLDVELLKVGHHGSSTSTSDSLLMRASPEVALISVGRNNRYGHPSPEVLARLSQAGVRVMRSDQHGTVRVRAYADGSLEVRAGL